VSREKQPCRVERYPNGPCRPRLRRFR
jgi:hypothetical protein